MAQVESFHDDSLGLRVFTFYGDLKLQELLKCIDLYYKGGRSNLVLFDFSDATLKDIESIPSKKIRKSSNRYCRSSDRKAFVFPRASNREQELEPVLKDYCQIEQHDSNFGLFQSLFDANRWLLQSKETHR